MKVIVLASGSKGNATYIESGNTRFLIDAGISYKQIKERLQETNIKLKELNAIFVTHEHADHVKHSTTVLEKTHAHLYINKKSFDALDGKVRSYLTMFPIHLIEKDTKYCLNDLFVVPINMSHDAKNTFGYFIKTPDHTAAYLTDTGFVEEKYFPILRTIEILIVESNHNVEMLMASKRIWPLKQRILSSKGHLSNENCHDLLKKIMSNNTKYVILAHLSEECNTEDLAYQASCPLFINSKTKLLIAKQHEAVDVTEQDAA